MAKPQELESLSPGAVLLGRLASRWLRQYWLDPDDVQEVPDFANPLWPRLRATLEFHNRLREKTPNASGGRKGLLHLRDARALIDVAHRDPEQEEDLFQIWREAAELR